MTRVGFVGVGRMGAAMLRCVVAAGHPVSVFDVDQEAVTPFTVEPSGQVRAAGSAADAARDAEVIDVVVNTDAQVLDACPGPDGVLAGAGPGAVVLVHSTVSLETLRAVAAEGASRHVLVADAPVSGAWGERSAGDLSVMFGGTAEAFARARPVLDTYGGLVLHLGDLGAGLDAKLALNVLRYLLYVASQEVMRFVGRTDLDPAQFRALADRSGAVALTGDFSVGRSPEDHGRRRNNAETAQKDLRAAVARADELATELPAAAFAIDRMHALWGVEPPDDRQV